MVAKMNANRVAVVAGVRTPMAKAGTALKGVHVTELARVTMQEELTSIFGRPVDLLTRNGVAASRNYIRRKAILNSAQVVYAAG